MDLRNAFNVISRNVVFEEVAAEFPVMARWVRWCYGQAAILRAGSEEVYSTSGTQQGDPLAPLLFTLALQKVTRQLAVLCPGLDLNSWYLDDGTLVGSRAELAKAMDYLASDEVRSMGLVLGDCEVWWPSGDQQFPELPVSVSRAPACGTEILKVPVGTEAFIVERLRSRLEKAQKIIEKLPGLEDPHVEFTLLRACLGSCRMAYSLRSTAPSGGVLEILKEGDDALRRALERVVGASVGASMASSGPEEQEWGHGAEAHGRYCSTCFYWIFSRHLWNSSAAIGANHV